MEEGEALARYLDYERRKRELTQPRRDQRKAERQWFERSTGIKVDPCFHWVEGKGFVERPAHRPPLHPTTKIVDGRERTWPDTVSQTMRSGGSIRQAADKWRNARLSSPSPNLRKKGLNWALTGQAAAAPTEALQPLVLPFAKREQARIAGATLVEPISRDVYQLLRENPRLPAYPVPAFPRGRLIEEAPWYPPPPRPPKPALPPYPRLNPTFLMNLEMTREGRRTQRPTGFRWDWRPAPAPAPAPAPYTPRPAPAPAPVPVPALPDWTSEPWAQMIGQGKAPLVPSLRARMQLDKLWELGWDQRTKMVLKPAVGGTGGLPDSGEIGRLAFILNNLWKWYQAAKLSSNAKAAAAVAVIEQFYPRGPPIVTLGGWPEQDAKYFRAIEAAFGPYRVANWAPGGKGYALEQLRKIFPPMK